MSDPLENAIVGFVNSADPDRTKQKWLAAVADHPETTDADKETAREVLQDGHLIPNNVRGDVSKLVRLRFVIANPNGTYAAVFPFGP